jgi:hypothetical protein
MMLMGSVERISLRHKGLVTAVAIAGLLLNLLVIGSADPPSDLVEQDLPMAAQCQGGGAGCAEQPLIPPPALGLPRFDPPPPPVYGALVRVEPDAPSELIAAPPRAAVPPPLSAAIA